MSFDKALFVLFKGEVTMTNLNPVIQNQLFFQFKCVFQVIVFLTYFAIISFCYYCVKLHLTQFEIYQQNTYRIKIEVDIFLVEDLSLTFQEKYLDLPR